MKFIKIDKNGTKYFEKRVTCWRCGNIAGGLYIVGTNNGQMVPSGLDNGVCWRCHGTGYTTEIVKEYTPEHLAKLEKARARREAKKAAELAEKAAAIEAEEKRIEAERVKAIKERIAEYEQKRVECSRSQYVGNIGERLEITAIVKRSFAFERPSYYGYGSEICHVHEFVDDNGNVFVWYSSAGISANEGDAVKVRGTVKNHSEYIYKRERVEDENGVELPLIITKQTVLTRCKVQEIN